MQDLDNNDLDIAVNYSNAGVYEDGLTLLTSIENPQNPLVYYYLAWFYANTNQASKVKELLSLANLKSIDYCFPYRSETEKILKFAVKEDSKNNTAFHLLGNLLFDNRKGDAIAAWESAGEINPDVPMVWRNLAFAAFHYGNNVEKAISLILRAIKDDKTQPLWYVEMAKYYDHSTRNYKECLSILQENIDVVKIGAGAPKSVVKLLNMEGEYDEAIEMLSTHHFRTWEGGRVIHSYYVDAYTLRALRYMNDLKYDEAIEDLKAAKLYSVNLEVGKGKNDGRNAMMHYLMGVCYEKKGKKKTAKHYFELSANTDNSKGDLKYYQAMAALKLNNNELANKLFQKLIKEGQKLIERGASLSGIGVDEASTTAKSNSSGYYLKVLGEKGMGNDSKSKELLNKSLD